MSDRSKIEWTDAIKKRFWSYVNICEPNECWPWTGGRFRQGYGQFRVGNKKAKAHRIAFEIANGRPPAVGLMVCHSCDNTWCCNPAHLWEGSCSDNAIDSYKKGRGARFNLPRKSGEENPSAKLVSGQVLEIRAMRQSGSLLKQIASRYSISVSQVRNIVERRSWAQIQG